MLPVDSGDEIPTVKMVNKAQALAALYNNAKVQGLGILHYDPRPMTEAEAAEILKTQTKFDYYKGRVMKVDLSGDEFDPWGYDRDNGKGMAQEVVRRGF